MIGKSSSLPNIKTIETRISDIADTLTNLLKTELLPYQFENRRTILLDRYGAQIGACLLMLGMFSLSGVLMPFFGQQYGRNIDGFFLVSLVLLVCSTWFLYITFTTPSAALIERTHKFNKSFYNHVFALLNIPVTHISDPSKLLEHELTPGRELWNELQRSRLFSSYALHKNFSLMKISNPLTITFLERDITIFEIHTPVRKRTANVGMQGYFVAATLPKPLSGYTYLSTERNKKDHGKLVFLNSLETFGFPDGVVPVKTELEWNEFEEFLHVVASDPVEARYILAPDFMEDLYAWWKQSDKDIRMAFYGSDFYMYVPIRIFRGNRLPQQITNTVLREEVEYITTTLIYILKFIEDVEYQLRK